MSGVGLRSAGFLLSFPFAVATLLFVCASSAVLAQTGIFNGPRDYVVGTGPESVVVADFNGDGFPDIATANFGSNNVSVLVQNNDGTFQPAVSYAVGQRPLSLQMGDVNGDGKLDLLFINSADGTLGILLGNGDGTFQTEQTVTLPVGSLSFLAVGDFNGDTKLDVAISTPSAQVGQYNATVLLGNGDGTFQSPVTYPLPAQPISLAAADFNGDGKLDLVTAGVSSNGTAPISVLLGKGDGTFKAALGTKVNQVTAGLVLADFNQDGKLDIATATASANTSDLTVLLGNGDGTFAASVLPIEEIPLAAGDLNGDGKPDVIGATESSPTLPSSLITLINNGNGTFTAGTMTGVELAYPSSPANAQLTVALADLTSDQKLDLIAPAALEFGSYETGYVTVVRGNGDGSFANFPSYPVSMGVGQMGTADFNGDGKQDVAVGIDTVDVNSQGTLNTFAVDTLLNNNQGFSPATITQVQANVMGASNAYLSTGDFNGDGHPDVVFSGGGEPGGLWPGISILLGNGDGTFQSPVLYGSGMSGPVAVGDFNNDGKLDVFGVEQGALGVLLGNGDGTFGSPVTTATNQLCTNATGADFNRDGKLDIACWAVTGVFVMLGNGDGTFSGFWGYSGQTSGTSTYGVVSADMNGDGILDLVIGVVDGTSEQPQMLVLLGNGDGTFQTSPITTVLDDVLRPFGVADFNLDGTPDVISFGSWDDVTVMPGNGDGTLQAPLKYHVPSLQEQSQSYYGTVADFDGNGSADGSVGNGSNVSLLLSALGNTAPAAVVAPGAFSFGNVIIGQSSSMTATLTYNATTALSISGITITGAQASAFSETNTCGTSLAAGMSCTITVTFTPQAIGTYSASIQIADDAFNSPQTISLSGVGGTSSVLLTPGSLKFGSQFVGSTSAAQTVSLTNTGSLALTINGIFVTGPQAGDFAQTNNCGSSLASGAGCTITITFTPAAFGTRSGMLDISDSASSTPQTVTLSGSAAATSVGLTAGSNPTTATVAAGKTATYTLVIGGAGMSGTATLACTGAPTGVTCTVPGSVTVNATKASTFNVSVATTAPSAASIDHRTIRLAGFWATLLLGLVCVPMAYRKRNAAGLYLCLMLGSLLIMSSCGFTPAASTTGGSGGSGGGSTSGTPAGTYNLRVTATLNSSEQSLNLQLIVQ